MNRLIDPARKHVPEKPRPDVYLPRLGPRNGSFDQRDRPGRVLSEKATFFTVAATKDPGKIKGRLGGGGFCSRGRLIAVAKVHRRVCSSMHLSRMEPTFGGHRICSLPLATYELTDIQRSRSGSQTVFERHRNVQQAVDCRGSACATESLSR